MHFSMNKNFNSDSPSGNKSGKMQLERSEISARFQWRLQDIYQKDQDWENDFLQVKNMLPVLKSYAGSLGQSATNLFHLLQKVDQLKEILGKLVVYANMRWHEDMRMNTYQAMSDRVNTLSVEVQTITAFIDPEIIAIPDDRLEDFFSDLKDLELYRHYLHNLRRQREHILSEKEEQLLAMASEPLDQPQTIFEMYNNADIKFPIIQDAQGREIELTKALYLKLMEEPNRETRIRAYNAFWPEYERMKNTLAATLSTHIKRDVFYARARKYPDCLEAALDGSNIPVRVYENLVQTITANLAPMHRYMALRKRALKLAELHPYDLYCPLVPEINWTVKYQEAVDTVEKALTPMGTTYLDTLTQAFHSGWIDVYENRGKRSGAYSWGSYRTHPYILMNYMDKLRDLFTLAHELGHSMHSFFSQANQPIVYGNYVIFLAEIASTTNEALVMDYLLKLEQSHSRKIHLLTHYIQEIVTTVYAQTLYAQFEKQIHEYAEAGQPLTVESLSRTFHELCRQYYGPDLILDPEYDLNWARIPHFYYTFYVYQYATGYSAAIAIATRILAGDQALRDRYLDFLKSGSSDYAINILRKMGVDMTVTEPIEAVVRIFNQLLDELESMF